MDNDGLRVPMAPTKRGDGGPKSPQQTCHLFDAPVHADNPR
jgi:hypothetical protein